MYKHRRKGYYTLANLQEYILPDEAFKLNDEVTSKAYTFTLTWLNIRNEEIV